jgi:PBSX family phage terminase large subunit
MPGFPYATQRKRVRDKILAKVPHKVFKPHEYQAKALQSQKRIIVLLSGIQGGKTICLAHWLWIKINQHPGDNHLVVAPSYKILNQSTLMALRDTLFGLGEYNKNDSVFYLNGGGAVFLRSGDDPNSFEGITNVRSVCADEAGQLSSDCWINIVGRSSFLQAQILLATTPYGFNWLFRDVVEPAQKGKRDDVDLFNFSSIANPKFRKEEFELQKKLLDPRVFKRRYCGEFVRLEGLVYDCLEEENVVDYFSLPNGTRYFGGVDWGYSSSPFALTVRALTPEGEQYTVSEFKKSGLTPGDVVRIVTQKTQIYNVNQWFCDPSRPEMIESLNKAKCSALKGENDIQAGVAAHRALIAARKYKIFREMCPELLKEYETYSYPEHRHPDKKAVPDVPTPVNNHLMDCERYCTLGIKHLGTVKFVPKVADFAEERRPLSGAKRIAWLTKGRGRVTTMKWQDY